MADKESKLRKWQRETRALLEGKIHPENKLSKLHRFVHFWVLVWQSFSRNRCPVRASALAYTTLLSLIPLLAVVVSITGSFLKSEGEEQIDQFIAKMVGSVAMGSAKHAGAVTNSVSANPSNAAMVSATNLEVSTSNSTPLPTNDLAIAPGTNTQSSFSSLVGDQRAVAARKDIARYIHEFIQNSRSGALGVTGSVVFIIAAFSLLSRIEDTFNDIWGVARGRNWFVRIALYWGVLTLTPVLLVVAFGLATGPHLESTKHLLESLPLVSSVLYRFGFQLLPVVVLCITFTLFYMLIPNIRVRWNAALVGGIVGGVLFHLNNMVSVLYVSRVVSNSRIYGSLGLVAVFMIGLYLSWLILLFGAQMAYAFQNRKTYLEEKQVENVNQRGREFVALRVMTALSQHFDRGEAPPTLMTISQELNVPSRLIRQILNTLVSARLVAETSGVEPGYLPARALANINCHDVLLALRASQGHELATRDEPVRAEVYGEFHRIEEADRQAASLVTMLQLAQRSRSLLSENGEANGKSP